MLVRCASHCLCLVSLYCRCSAHTENLPYIHIKIDMGNDLGYVVGEFSKPFPTVPEAIKYYTCHKLRIRGADHKRLKYPVNVQWMSPNVCTYPPIYVCIAGTQVLTYFTHSYMHAGGHLHHEVLRVHCNDIYTHLQWFLSHLYTHAYMYSWTLLHECLTISCMHDHCKDGRLNQQQCYSSYYSASCTIHHCSKWYNNIL